MINGARVENLLVRGVCPLHLGGPCGFFQLAAVLLFFVPHHEGPEQASSQHVSDCIQREIRMVQLGHETKAHDQAKKPERAVSLLLR